ncbi:cupin domain-containing protein [Paraliomyxa miuraensis]|uniref:cupin domain-containing protein n=1 Tax=Paraliomyxa miuraensis TaxID=376150 RepID=UPI00225C2091|nr:cupin domain-containing protein [Paraliomyxa miuraensis]MCX4245385.1 cupin domain-containing protein [Paraliomyxa miuraensis]
MSTYSASDLVIAPSQGEKTASDMVIIARTAKLSGHFSIMEGEVRPKEILSFHTHHNEDQHMYIISGELCFEVGGAGGIRFEARAGSHVLKPRGSSHGFWNLGTQTVRYIETSTEDGFERFVDSRQQGLGSMVGGATRELGMSFETDRTLEVMKEFGLTGLAGANLPPPRELLQDPAFRELLHSEEGREFFLYMAGVKVKEAFARLLP